ncbi:phage tail tape measure protein [Acidovorax temperans]|uniref:phage tail tape measure protein n=1 Tax=Acidovorax temperans TaxID=80878 RepID=UPI002897B180|nr:phage tail tape measure protein [Acidovorax temperans]
MAFKPIEILINAKDNASAVFGSLQTKVVAVGAAIATYFGINAFVGVVKGAADLETALSRVQAATGASADEMAALRAAAEDAGATTKFTSTEAAGALENLAKAGLNSKDAIATLPAVLALAQAGDIELATASEYVTKAVMGMGLAFTDAGRVADVLAKGANATNTSVEGLAQALSYAAPVANSLGLSLETTVAIIGKFADAGIDASRAGTALNSILSQFADPASKFRNELASAGITTNNFEKALYELAAAGPAGSKAILAVGTEAGPALRALLNQGMGALGDLTTQLKNAKGSAAATAEVMQNNLNGSLNGLSSAWDTLKNALGTPVLPVLKEGVDQLAGALRSAVADGTVGKFGEAIAAAFQAGIKWVREFLATVDFNKVMADLRGFADRTGETFTQIGVYATNAGNTVQLAYGVMSAGVNAVLTAIYGIGSVFAEVAAKVMEGVALLREGLAAVTFGELSKSFALAAEDARSGAQAFGEAAQAMRDKATESLSDMADGAQMARDGFDGLARSIQTGSKAAADAQASISAMAREIEATGKAAAESKAKVEAKAQADQAAKTAAAEHAESVRQLRQEYASLVQNGDLQGAAEKLQQLNTAMAQTSQSAQDMADQVAAAFQRLGVTSSADLTRQAENAKRDYQTIKDSGTATAEDLAAAFRRSAEDAIAANKGIAPSWVSAEASARGYRVEVDETGKSTLVLRDAIEKAAASSGRAGGSMAADWKGVSTSIQGATQALADYQRRVQQKYGRPGEGDAGLFDTGRRSTRGEELAPGVQEVGTGGYQFRNKDGMTSDAKGNVQQQFVWTRSTIIDYLKQAGLEDAVAQQLSKQFLNGKGEVDYLANDAQKRWAGKYGTLAEALGKVAEYYKYDEGGQIEAQDIVDRAKRDKEIRDRQRNPNAPAPSPTPAPAPGPGAGTGGNTYINNITINGVGDWGMVRGQTRHTDADSAKTEVDLLRALAQARGAAIQ